MDKCKSDNNKTEIHIRLDNNKFISFELSYDDDPISIINELCDIFTNLILNVNIVSEDLKTLLHSKRITAFHYL